MPDSEELNTLSLRTIDPLLVSFREGWKSPDDPSWKVEMIGSTKIMIPGFLNLSGEDRSKLRCADF